MAITTRLILTTVLIASSLGPAFAQDQGDKPNDRARLRVLLFADAPTREYQFVRDAFVRAPEKVTLTICLQNADKDCDQYVEPEQLLSAFPALAVGKGKPGAFDLVIAFDPDWTVLSKAKLQALHDWVHDQGGGLVVIAGPVHSYRLARPGGRDLSALLTMMPVRLLDPRLHAHGAPDPQSPHAVRVRDGAGALVTLEKDGASPTAGWDKFHWNGAPARDRSAAPRRGFYAAAPVGAINPRAQVVASLVDPNGRDHPFLVTMPHGKGRVVFLASGELWRLRSYDQNFHMRMWWNVTRYATEKSEIALASRISVNEVVVESDQAFIEALLVDDKGVPLDAAVKPTLRLTPPPGGNEPAVALAMTPKAAGVSNGVFQARVPVAGPGQYRVEVTAAKTEVSAKLIVKSYYQAHMEDRAFLMRQYDLSRRAQQCAKGLFALSSKLAAESDPALVKEGKVYREAFDPWQIKHDQLTGAILNAKKLTDFQAAVKDSQALYDRMRGVRAMLLFADAVPPELLAFADAEETLAGSRELALSSIRAALLLAEERPDAKWSAAQYRAHADGLDAAVKGLKESQALMKAAHQAYRKKLADVVGVRVETARYLKMKFADPAERAVEMDFSEAAEALADLSKQAREGKIIPNLLPLAQRKVLAAQTSMEALAAAPNVGALLVELTRLETEQARQTHALTKIKDRLEADLLKQLLDGK